MHLMRIGSRKASKVVAPLKDAILAVYDPPEGEGVHVQQDGIFLGVSEEPMPRTPILYPASICFLAQGSKTVHMGSLQCSYDPGRFLLSRFNVTAESEAPAVTKRNPLVGLGIELDMPRLGQVVAEIGPGPVEGAGVGERPALTSHEIDDALTSILERVVLAAGNDTEWRVLSEGLLRELYYRLVLGSAGPLLRERAASVGNTSQVAAAIGFIERNLTEAFSTEDIARAAAVSVSGLHAKFKAVTGQAPMQFVKRLRLDRAHKLIMSGDSVTEASLASGYNSVSQFSREFRREYGVPPSQMRPR